MFLVSQSDEKVDFVQIAMKVCMEVVQVIKMMTANMLGQDLHLITVKRKLHEDKKD